MTEKQPSQRPEGTVSTGGANHGWGYLTVQVASREPGAVRLLVDGRYTRQQNRDAVSTAWLWEMAD